MKRILIILLGLFSVAYGQTSPTSAKTRFVNGLYAGTKLDSYFNTSDSNGIYWRADSVLRAKYKGAARTLAFTNYVDSSAALKYGGTGTTGFLPRFNSANTLVDSRIVDTGTLTRVNADLYTAGTMAIGGFVSNNLLRIGGVITGAASVIAVNQNAVVQSPVTTTAFGYNNTLATQAASFNLGSYIHYGASQGTIGLGSSVTTQTGFNVPNSLTAATTNYGFRSQIPTASGRWNFYADGTAPNYFLGDMLLNTITQDGIHRFIVNGAARANSVTITAGASGLRVNRSSGASATDDALVASDPTQNYFTNFAATRGMLVRQDGQLRFLGTGALYSGMGITANRFNGTSLVLNKDSLPINTSNIWFATQDTTNGRIQRRNLSSVLVSSISFDTTTRVLSIPTLSGGTSNVVIPRGSSSGTSGIVALSSNKVGNLVTVSGDNGSSTTFSIRDSDSTATLSSLTAGDGLSGTAYNGSAPQTWRVDTSTISTKANVTALLLPKLSLTDTAAMLSNYARLSGAAFTGGISGTNLTMTGRTTLAGTNSLTDPLPLGSGSSNFQITNGNDYGLVSEILTNGNPYLQAMRTDGLATAYDIMLQPVGGNVLIAGAFQDASSKLTVKGGIKSDSTFASIFRNNGVGSFTTLSNGNLSMYASTTLGNVIAGAGSTNDITIVNKVGDAVFQVPTGTTNVVYNGNITAPSFIRSGGTSSQFLKADGSVDNNSYLKTSDTASAFGNFARKSGETFTGAVIAPNFYSTGFAAILNGSEFLLNNSTNTLNSSLSTISGNRLALTSASGGSLIVNNTTTTLTSAFDVANTMKSAGLIQPISLKTANYTLTANDHTVIFDCSAANRTVTLPVGVEGQIFVIKAKNASTNAAIITPNGSQTIEGNSTYSLSNTCGDAAITIQFLSGNWNIISSYLPPCL